LSGPVCHADSDEPSHVIKAMKPDSSALRQMIRFSPNVDNSQEEITKGSNCGSALYSHLG